MNKVEDKLLDILRYEVLAQDRTDNNTISLEESKQLLRLAKEHTVQGVVANAVVNNKIHIVTQQAQESDRKKIIYDFLMFDVMQKHHYENYKQALVDFASLMNKFNEQVSYPLCNLQGNGCSTILSFTLFSFYGRC